MHNRRKVVFALSSCVLTAPRLVTAQTSARVYRVGFLGPAPADSYAPRVEGLRSGLRTLGYVEGRNLELVFRWADNVNQLPELAAELVRLKVDIIFASSSTQVGPALAATRTIPIVFANHADPVGTGHVASLRRPGGNATGLSMLLTDLVGKQLQLLKEIVPRATRFGVVWNPETPSHHPAAKEFESGAKVLGIQLTVMPGRNLKEFDAAFSKMGQQRVGGVLVLPSLLTYSERAYLAKAALAHRLPGMWGLRENTEAGGLASYGTDTIDLHRRAATYIDKILKGAIVGDLPVEQPLTYEFVINLKTAKTLGVTFPPTTMLRADRMIE